jgi:hypothetical protein
MTAALHRGLLAAQPLAPVTATLDAMFGVGADLPGLARGLHVAHRAGWTTAADLITTGLPDLLRAAEHRWSAQPHAAAALAWKSYTYWLTLPAVLGWASARRVPLLRADDVLVHFEDHRPLLTLGLAPDITVAVLPNDPIAAAGLPHVQVVADENALLGAFRTSLLDQHLTPMLDALHGQVRLGTRTLLGSVASGMAHAVLRSADLVPGSSSETIAALTGALGVADLIELVKRPGGRLEVQRKTCCLAFTLPQPKVCSGCCIALSSGRR